MSFSFTCIGQLMLCDKQYPNLVTYNNDLLSLTYPQVGWGLTDWGCSSLNLTPSWQCFLFFRATGMFFSWQWQKCKGQWKQSCLRPSLRIGHSVHTPLAKVSHMAKPDLSGVGTYTLPLAGATPKSHCRGCKYRDGWRPRVNNAVFHMAVSAVAGTLHCISEMWNKCCSINVERIPVN